VFNDLQSLEMIVAGSAEMFWRGAFPGTNFSMDPSARDLTAAERDRMEDTIEEYVHGLKRFLLLRGVEAQPLDQQVADPSNHIDAILGNVAAGSGIPKRVLTGSEAAELASSQDRRSWFERVEEYRSRHAEPHVLRPTLSRLIDVGALPAPLDGRYSVRWPEDDYATEKERAETAKTIAEALAAYARGGVDLYVDPLSFLTRVLGFDAEVAREVVAAALPGETEEGAE
jgi:hypothetical protein